MSWHNLYEGDTLALLLAAFAFLLASFGCVRIATTSDPWEGRYHNALWTIAALFCSLAFGIGMGEVFWRIEP